MPRPQPCRKSCANPGRLRELGFLQAGRAGTPNEGWVQSRKSRSSRGSAQEAYSQEAPPHVRTGWEMSNQRRTTCPTSPHLQQQFHPLPSQNGMMGLVGKLYRGTPTGRGPGAPFQGQLTSREAKSSSVVSEARHQNSSHNVGTSYRTLSDFEPWSVHA